MLFRSTARRARGGPLGTHRCAAWRLTRRAGGAGARGRADRRTEPGRSTTAARGRRGPGTTGLDAGTWSCPTASARPPCGATRPLSRRPGWPWSARATIAIAPARSTSRASTASIPTRATAVAPWGPRDHPPRSGRRGVPPSGVAGQAIATERETAAEAAAGAPDTAGRATSATTTTTTTTTTATATASSTATGARSAAVATTSAIVAPASLGHRGEVGHVEVLAHLLGGRGRVLTAEHAHQPDVVDPILDRVESLEQPRQAIALDPELGLNVRPRSLVHCLLQGFGGSGGSRFPRGALRGRCGFQRDLLGLGSELGRRWLGGLGRRQLRFTSTRGASLGRRALGRGGDPGLGRGAGAALRPGEVGPTVGVELRGESSRRRVRRLRLGLPGNLLLRRNRGSGLRRLLRHLARGGSSRRSFRAMRPANRRGLAQDRVREFRDRFHDGCCTLLVGTGNLRQIGMMPGDRSPGDPNASPPDHGRGPRGGGDPFPRPARSLLRPRATSSARLRAWRSRPWRSW